MTQDFAGHQRTAVPRVESRHPRTLTRRWSSRCQVHPVECSLGHDPAVHGQDGASRPLRLVRRKGHHRRRDLFRPAHATQRVYPIRHRPRLGVLDPLGDPWRLHRGRADAVAPDLVLGVLQSHGLGDSSSPFSDR